VMTKRFEMSMMVWRPRFLINPNSRSTQLTVVKSRSTWALTSKNSLTYSSDPLWLVNTLVGPTHGQRLGRARYRGLGGCCGMLQQMHHPPAIGEDEQKEIQLDPKEV
jgi:hypothetical protein